MISSLAPCFTGTFMGFKDALALPGEYEASLEGRALLDPQVTEKLLGRFAGVHPGADRRALVSMWTQWYFGALVIPVTAAIVLLDRDLPVELERVRIAFHEDGRVAAIVVADDGTSCGAGMPNRFSRLFMGHVDPLIRHLAEHFRVSPRLLWTNAATVFEWTLQQAAAYDDASVEALAEGHALLEARTDMSGKSNPMCGAVQLRHEDGQTFRRRKVCCLRYLLPGVDDCGSLCPLDHGAAAG
jgi:ferric iron reductase protein FhuF